MIVDKNEREKGTDFGYYTGPSKLMDLVLRYNNICKKKDIQIGYAVMCSSAHKIFLKLTCTYFYAYPMHTHDMFSIVVSILTAAVSQYNGKCTRESTVVWLAEIVKRTNVLKGSVCWGIMHNSITGPFFFAENIVTVYNTFMWVCYNCLSCHKLTVLNKKKRVKFCFNIVCSTPLHSGGTKCPEIDFLIG
jgi:hypothetical protein